MGRLSKPQKQDNERIVQQVKRYRETSDESAFQDIVSALHGYLQHLALKKFFFIAGTNSDDVYQEGLYALATKAIPDYDETKGPFVNFAKLCIRRHIITVLKAANNRKNQPLNGAVSMDALCHDEEDGPVSISSLLDTKLLPNARGAEEDDGVVDQMVRSESFDKLKQSLVSRLTPLESTVLDLYLQNFSYVDIATYMNKTRRGRNRVNCKVIDNALCRIKKKALEIDEVPPREESAEDDDRWSLL
jgi:RNA polymerase sporulation-specific sigma factor